MGRTRPSTEQLAVLGLACAALAAPIPLYLLALSGFGLPHVIWEFVWVYRNTRSCFPPRWWQGLSALLLLQGLARWGSALGWISSNWALVLDLSCLALAIALVALLPKTTLAHRGRKALALGSAAAITALCYWGEPALMAGLLVFLSFAHNYTPLALSQLGRPERNAWHGYFMLTLALPLVATTPWLAPAYELFLPWAPSEYLWLTQHGGGYAWLPTFVMAQCLHYYAVIRWLPQQSQQQWHSRFWFWPAVMISAALSFYFFTDFKDARRLYAVASGMHAWLEWPLLLALCSPRLGKHPA